MVVVVGSVGEQGVWKDEGGCVTTSVGERFVPTSSFFFLQALESLEGRGGSSVDRERGSWLPTTASVATGARESFCLALERQCIELLSVLVSFSVLQRPLRIWYLCLLGCYVIASKYLWGNFPPET